MITKQPSSVDIRVGQSIRAHRLISGLSQSELADKLGVSFQQVQKYEKGVNRVGAGRLLQIAGILNIQVNTLFETHAETSPGGTLAGRAPVHLIADKAALRLLTAYADITDRSVRRGVSQLVDAFARASRKVKKKSAHRAA